jgi:hypothetical protein
MYEYVYVYIYIYIYIYVPCGSGENYITRNFDLYSSPNIFRVMKSRRMRWAGHVARMGESRREYRVLVGKREGKRPLGIPRRSWVDKLWWIFRKWGVGV